MLNKYMIDQPVACKILENTIKREKVSHAYLFISNQYSKTMDLVIDFAKKILTYNIENEKLKTKIINEIDNGSYSDLIIVETDGLWIKKESIDNLQKEFSKKSIIGNKRVYIINNAHKLNLSSSNSILKFLEEPEKDIIAILITDNKYQLLDTIISRCVNINLNKDKIKTFNKEISLKEKIANNIFNNEKEKNAFLEHENSEDFIKNIVNFIIFYEKNTHQTILYLNKLWHEKVKEKKDIIIAFDLMIMFYKDLLNRLFNRNIENFTDYKNEIEEMCDKNTIEEVCDKINIIIKMREKIKYNVNNKLLMDKLIVKLGSDNCG